MTSLLAIFGFLAAVLYEGQSLTCEHCTGYGSTSCKGPMKECADADETCFQGLESNTLDNDTRVVPYKYCLNLKTTAPVAYEASDHSFRNSRLQVRLVTQYGKILDELQVSPINLTSNGYQCPDCFVEGSLNECTSDRVIKCVGRQTECMNAHGKISRPRMDLRSYSFIGCCTPGACSLFEDLPGTHSKMSTLQYKCSPASKV